MQSCLASTAMYRFVQIFVSGSLPGPFHIFLLSSTGVDSLDTPLVTWQRQDSDCSVCFHLECWNARKLLAEFSRRERCRLVETISPAEDSTAINHEDSWPGSLSTSPVESEWLQALGTDAPATLGSSSADFPACLDTLSSPVYSLPAALPWEKVGKLHAHAALTHQSSRRAPLRLRDFVHQMNCQQSFSLIFVFGWS